jgi:alkylation response protein AidB-like acyl-CoA dehydrogenase
MPTFKRADQEQFEKAKDLLEAAPSAEPGFVKSLFFGRVKLDEVLPFPKQDPAESQRTGELLSKVDAFLKNDVDADLIDVEERIPQSVIDGLGKLGVLGMTVPREYGGGGFSHTAYCRVLERISAHCASTAVMVGAHQSIGLKALVLMGNEEQKRRFLPDLAAGKMIAAFSLSEPEVGSDAASVQTEARLSPDGSHWILNGQKRYATNGALAGMMTVMAKTPITENGKTRDKVTAFIVTPDLPGFEILSPNRSKCGVRGSWQATLKFTDMPVPADRILGQLGKGLKVALSVLDYGRCTLSAGCVGGAKRLLELSVERARSRHQFGRPIGEFHLIKAKLAAMAETTFAMDALTYLAAGLVDRHSEDMMLESAIAKLFCSEGLWRVADDAMQIWGGEGYMREYGIERALRDARINRIVEGTTEVMTAFVALVGMKGVGEEFEQILRAGKHPIDNFGRLARFAREQWRDIIIGADVCGLHEKLEDEGHTLAKLSNQLAREVSRLLRTYRQNILDMQLLQERIAWSAIDLYAMAAVISKLQTLLTATNGDRSEDLRRDLLIGKGFCRSAAERITQRLHALHANHDAAIVEEADAVMGWKSAGDKAPSDE